jgi:glycosyltransferase involved in cell wall biosynthesis
MQETMTMRVSVALCTFNGAKYLQEQLQSIAAQSLPPDELVICDDGSTDGTIELLRAFADTSTIPVHLHLGASRGGVIANFERAIAYCTGDVIALADQDDAWLPDKLKITVGALRAAQEVHGEDVPLLVHTDLRVVDAAKNVIATSFWAHQEIRARHRDALAELLLENFVTGCTLVMNRSLRNLALPIPPDAVMHDWWLALVAAAKGKVITLPDVTILYRQHGSNTVGARRRSLAKYILGWREFVGRVEARINQSEALETHLKGRGPPATEEFVRRFNEDIRGGGLVGLLWLIKRGVRMQQIRRTFAVYLLAALKIFAPARPGEARVAQQHGTHR